MFKEAGLRSLRQHNPVTKGAAIPATSRLLHRGPICLMVCELPALQSSPTHVSAVSFSKIHPGWQHNHQGRVYHLGTEGNGIYNCREEYVPHLKGSVLNQFCSWLIWELTTWLPVRQRIFQHSYKEAEY